MKLSKVFQKSPSRIIQQIHNDNGRIQLSDDRLTFTNQASLKRAIQHCDKMGNSNPYQFMTARIQKEKGRAPTQAEIDEAKAKARENSIKLAGHGRERHGYQTTLPPEIQEAQRQRDIQDAEDITVQLKLS